MDRSCAAGRGVLAALVRRPRFFLETLRGTARFVKRVQNYRPIASDFESHLRDEVGVIPANARKDFEVIDAAAASPDRQMVEVA